MSLPCARREATKDGGQAGQTLVETALVIPIITFLFMGLIEVALLYNAFVGVNRASQNGAHLAAIMGNQAGADCLILTEIEEDIYVPNDIRKIQQVIIERSTKSGNGTLAEQRWERNPSAVTPCTMPDGTETFVPYVLLTPVLPAYPEAQRCNVLKGCPDPPFSPARSTVDNIAVQIRYRHIWATPLNEMFGFFAGGDVGWTIVQRNVFRIEPVL